MSAALAVLAFLAASGPHLVHHLGDEPSAEEPCLVLHVLQSAPALLATSAALVGLGAAARLVLFGFPIPNCARFTFPYHLRAPPRLLTAIAR